MGHLYGLILPDWGFSLANITTDIFAATSTDDPVHNEMFIRYISGLQPRTRTYVQKNGGRTFALLHLKSLLNRLLDRVPPAVTAQPAVSAVSVTDEVPTVLEGALAQEQ